MNRPVFALFANRSDAEAARARLAREVRVGSTRMLAKDTAAAVGALKLDPRLKDHYRDALQGGDHLLIANVARGEDPKRIVQALASNAAPEMPPVEPQQSYTIEDEQGAPAGGPETAAEISTVEPAPAPQPETPASVQVEQPIAPPAAQEPAPEVPPQVATGEALKVGEPLVARGGGSAGREALLPSGGAETGNVRRISYEEVQSLGLLKDRTIEVVEMCEEPVIAKEAVVREEVVIRKTTSERAATINETVRRTQVEVEELQPGDGR